MEKWILGWLMLFPFAASAQVEHWAFEAICTGLEAPFFKDVYTAPGHYRVSAIAEESSTDFIADSVQGNLLALFNEGGRKYWHIYATCRDSAGYFAPNDVVDFDRAQVAVNPSSDTKTVFGLTLFRVDLYLAGKPVGEAWVAEHVVVPGAYAFTLPDGRWVTVLEVRYETLTFSASTRLIRYEVLEEVTESVFSLKVPEGYQPMEEIFGED